MSEPFALINAQIPFGTSGDAAEVDRTIVVGSAGSIEVVGPTEQVRVPPGYRILDVSGSFVLPGLINAHAHLFADGKPLPPVLLNERAQGVVQLVGHSPLGKLIFKRRTKTNVITQLNSGVTTLRSVGDVGYEVVAVAEEIDAGKYVGPRILPSGPLLAITGGHGAPQIALTGDSPWDHRRNARKNRQRGVKAMKISATAGVTDARAVGYAGRPEMTEEEMTAICEEAHVAGIRVAAHAQGSEGIRRALRAGVDTIEHGADMTPEIIELFGDNPRSLTGRSALIPTMMACLPLVRLDRSVTGITEVVRANAELAWERMLQGISAAREHGIAIGMGTDSALTYATHYNAWRELDFLTRYGELSPTEVLTAATRTNAEILGIDDVTGTIEVGKAADLVVLESDPLDGFTAFKDPKLVIAGGTIIDHPSVSRFDELDAMLDGC